MTLPLVIAGWNITGRDTNYLMQVKIHLIAFLNAAICPMLIHRPLDQA